MSGVIPRSSPPLTISEIALPCKIFSYFLNLRKKEVDGEKATLHLPTSKKFRKIALTLQTQTDHQFKWEKIFSVD